MAFDFIRCAVKYRVDCALCSAEIKTGVMGKLRGTYVKKAKKSYPVCRDCQKQGEAAIKEKLGKRL